MARQTVWPDDAAATWEANDEGVALRSQLPGGGGGGGGGAAAVTTAVTDELADADPPALLAVTTERTVWPTSAAVSV